ncbi:translation protein SH3-like domain-containing protein [Diaporthe sp. PMI_573]|nr:translation protein SH3-like domain-containing protein [Diaporthaceae sp. PMI_573]
MASQINDNTEYDFASANAGAAPTFPVQANHLKQGGHVVLEGHPCKITSIAKSKPGKHGHAKVVVTGVDVFTGKKHEGGGPAGHTMDVPVVRKASHMLLNVGRGSDGFLTLFDLATGAEKIDVRVPGGELGERIREKFGEGKDCSVVVLGAMGQEIAVEVVEKDRE